MNPYTDASGTSQPGDLPIIKSLADTYAISDNYHQAIMGGTGANFQAIVSADAAFFTNPDGTAGTPYANQIENPDAWKGTNNYYKQDGYGGGSYVGCFNPKLPGIKPVLDQLKAAGVNNPNCDAGHYYLVNNYNMYWNQDGSTNALGSDKFVLPPQSNNTIVTALDTANVSWKYYSADQGSDTTRYANGGRRHLAAVPLVLRHLRSAARLLRRHDRRGCGEADELRRVPGRPGGQHAALPSRSCVRSRRWPATRAIRRRTSTSCSCRIS